MTTDAGSIVTVDGHVDPSALGPTLPHEHLFIDIAETWYEPPDSAYHRRLAQQPVSLDTLWYIRRNLYQHEENMRLDSFEEAVGEVARFQRAGVGAIVDLTPKNTGGDPELVRALSRQTGVDVVHGTAYYTRPAHPASIDDRCIDDLAAEFVSDVRDGIDDTDVRAGIVGEIGVSGRIHDQEERVVRAGARAALRTGASLNIHTPGRTPHSQKDCTHPPSRWALVLLDIIEEEGLPPERMVMSHLDRTIFENLTYQRELAERGAFIEYDLWGLKAYFEAFDDGLPSDVRRVEWAVELIEAGYGSNLLVSHDIAYKIQRTRYGGFGYAHVLDNVRPMLRARGVSDAQFREITVENPARVLTFSDSE